MPAVKLGDATTQKLCPISMGHHATPCIGVACMAWRWTEPPLVNDAASAEERAVSQERRRGHCGLAGVPGFRG
jgi:hypothetical protein